MPEFKSPSVDLPMEKRMLKGGVILGYFAFIKKSYGKEGLNQCIEALGFGPKDVKAEKTYPRVNSDKVLQWLSENKGMDATRHCGAYTVMHLGILSYLVRFATWEKILHRAKESFRGAFLFGKMTIDLDEPNNKAVAKLMDVTSIKESCNAWQGVVEGAMRLKRANGVVTKTKCQIDGDPYCEYQMTWE